MFPPRQCCFFTGLELETRITSSEFTLPSGQEGLQHISRNKGGSVALKVRTVILKVSQTTSVLEVQIGRGCYPGMFGELAATLTALFGEPHFPPHTSRALGSVPGDQAPGLVSGGGRAPAPWQKGNLGKSVPKG